MGGIPFLDPLGGPEKYDILVHRAFFSVWCETVWFKVMGLLDDGVGPEIYGNDFCVRH